MEPWQSWAAAICIGGAAFWYYARDSKYFMKPRDTRSASVSEQSSQNSRRRNDKLPIKRREGNSNSANVPASYAEAAAARTTSDIPNGSKKRKAGRTPEVQSTGTGETKSVVASNNTAEKDTSLEDKEWAKQLDASRRGVVIGSSKAASQQKVKTKHQSEALSSSTPQPKVLNGSEVAAPKGDVSDMLEPAPAAPSVLRVTGNQEIKKQQTQKVEPAQETKKQRQNRKKAEERRQQREDDEKQRQALLENQRRTAREARGEPAKNGIVSSNPPAKKVWSSASVQTGGQPNGSTPTSAGNMTSNETPLLDTFDQDGLSTASSNEMYTNSTTPATVASVMDQDIPSEEAQLEMLSKLNENAGWNEVPTKGKKGKKKQQSTTTTETATPASSALSNGKDSNPFSLISTGELADEKEPGPLDSTPNINGQTNGAATSQYVNLPWTKGHPDDSDWAVF